MPSTIYRLGDGVWSFMLNVLVYDGPEAIKASAALVTAELNALLNPHYVVQPITLTQLATQPWSTFCALLVFPRLIAPFAATKATTIIHDYVASGGAFLAFGSSAHLSSVPHSNSSFAFFDKFNNTYIIPNFGFDHSHPTLATLKSLDGDLVRAVYQSCQPDFIGFKPGQGLKILASYLHDDKIAGLGCDIGGGRIALWLPALEQPLCSDPATPLISDHDNINQLDKERRMLFRRAIIYLGLHLPASSKNDFDDSDDNQKPIARPFPQFLVCSPDIPGIVARIIDGLSPAFDNPNSDTKVITDSNDTFQFHESTSTTTKTLLEESKFLLKTPTTAPQPEHIIIHRNGTLPSTTYTLPYFNISQFFHHLSSLRQSSSRPSTTWPMGSALFFSPAVTSTQTLLDKNPKYLSHLPTPTIHIASHQLLARGRGSNTWLSPLGSLSQSLHIRIPRSAGIPYNKLVFVQYLYALAVCEGVRDNQVLGDSSGPDEGGGEGGEGWRVRIKWPNDIYALIGPKGTREEDMEKHKIAGVLVNMNFSAEGAAEVVVGCGLNVFNEQPMTSLVQLLSNSSGAAAKQRERREKLSLERTAAVVLNKFEEMWERFVSAQGSFEPFLDAYLKRWLHNDQLVTLTTTDPPTLVRITGITLDHGLLRTIPEYAGSSRNPYFTTSSRKEEYIDLQPDGNSFDLMAGLIKAKC